MHRGLFLLSAPQRPELTAAYRQALALLDQFLRPRPEALTLLNLRGLWDMRKPYAWFADHGRWFLQLREPALAQECYRMAARLNPLQPKLWAGWWRARAAKPDRA